MNENQNNIPNSGFNDLKQVEMSIEAARKLVGSATMSMDHEQLENAKNAIKDAQTYLANARNEATGVDDDFLNVSDQILSQCEEQLNEAIR